jgi:hypothetical protein
MFFPNLSLHLCRSSIDRYVICRFGGYAVHELLLCVCGKFMMSPSGRMAVNVPKNHMGICREAPIPRRSLL